MSGPHANLSLELKITRKGRQRKMTMIRMEMVEAGMEKPPTFEVKAPDTSSSSAPGLL
ncbi:hypothetical protein H8959_002468 [Pygathrix nigripes]